MGFHTDRCGCFTVEEITWVSVGGKYLYVGSLLSKIILHHRIRRPPNPFWQDICNFDTRVKKGEQITEEETKE